MMNEYKAEVTNTDDPEKSGKIKVKCEAILSGGEELPGWIEPCFAMNDSSAGWFGIPPVGTIITLTRKMGNADPTIIQNISARVFSWRPNVNGTPPEEFTGSYGDKWGFYADGALFVIDRGTNEVYLKNKVGAKVTLTADGDFVFDMDSSIKLGGDSLLAALDGVVTKRCTCAFTGAPHPIASTSVMAKI